jgi:hypothetical protein
MISNPDGLPNELLTALDKAELLLNIQASTSSRPMGTEIVVNQEPRPNHTSASPSGTFTTAESPQSRHDARPTLFAEAGYRRWGTQSAVGVACKGVFLHSIYLIVVESD